MADSETGRDKIFTHLSSCCIIISYFCRTRVASGVSKHLQREQSLKVSQSFYPNSSWGTAILKTSVHETFKAARRAIIPEDGWPSWITFTVCSTGSERVDSRVGEMSELGERCLDSLLELLSPPQASSYCRHILIHWKSKRGGFRNHYWQITQHIKYGTHMSIMPMLSSFAASCFWKRHSLKGGLVDEWR